MAPSAMWGESVHQLLDLEVLARVVEPEQRAGLQVERLAQQIEGVVELLVDGLDRALRQLLLLLVARAHAALGRQRRGDQAEVACLFAHRRDLVLDAARCSRRWRSTSACRNTTCISAKKPMKPTWPGKAAAASGGAAGPKREHRLEADGAAASGRPTTQAVEGDQEADDRVDQRVDRRRDAARKRQQEVNRRQQQQAELDVGEGLAPGRPATLGRLHARRDLVGEHPGEQGRRGHPA